MYYSNFQSCLKYGGWGAVEIMKITIFLNCKRRLFNIKMDLLEIGLNVVDWIGLAQDRYRWIALVNSVMNLWVP
jgi:hypothetical protein